MTRLLILAALVMGAGRLFLAAEKAFVGASAPRASEAGVISGCFGFPKQDVVGGIRYIPDPSQRLLASFVRR